MPQYAYTIDGQRHVFEGPDPRTTAQFAQRWAAAHASAQAAAANDNRPQGGPRRSQFAVDLGARARQDVAGLSGAIDQVRAHPTDLFNGPRILSAVARYVPNALGLAPAAGVDQLTGPVIRGINARFGSHFDPRYATDQILNGLGLLAGAPDAPEALGTEAEAALARIRETSDVPPSSIGSGGSTARRVFPTIRGDLRATAQVGVRPQLAKSSPAVASAALQLHPNTPILDAGGENVVRLNSEFLAKHAQRMDALADHPKYSQAKYRSAIENNIINPVLDNPNHPGFNATDVQTIIQRLATAAEQERKYSGSSRIGDALDDANTDFRVMALQQQPWMARALGMVDMPRGMAPWAPSTGDTQTASVPQPTSTNAFSDATASGAQTLGSTTAADGSPRTRGFDFNALRPPRWLGPLMVGAANQGQAPPPQN